MSATRALAFAALLLPFVAAAPGRAQDYDRPPAGFQDQGGPDGGGYGAGGAPVDPSDPGALSVRVNKLESRIRDMTGQIEELQNANRRLVEQVQKFQADVEFRLQGKSGPSKHSEAEGLSGAPMDADPTVPSKSVSEARIRRGDAFDPSAEPTAPGAPKPLGSVASAAPPAPLDGGGDAPMDLAGARRGQSTAGGALAPTLQLPTAKAPGAVTTPAGTVIASTAPNSPQEEFEVALGYYRDKQYESAEKGFTAFLSKNPGSKLVPSATFYLGESFSQRGRPREAAEQYLKISQDYAQSTKAPEAMLHLGISLKALGAKEQACATFAEVNRKYPSAPAYVKTGAEREAKRAQC